jgi:hypothetical protein
MSKEPNPGTQRRAVVAFGGRIAAVVMRVALGVGMVALVLSERHTGMSYTSAWGTIRWVGFALVVLSLPPVIYDTFARYQRRKTATRSRHI